MIYIYLAETSPNTLPRSSPRANPSADNAGCLVATSPVAHDGNSLKYSPWTGTGEHEAASLACGAPRLGGAEKDGEKRGKPRGKVDGQSHLWQTVLLTLVLRVPH